MPGHGSYNWCLVWIPTGSAAFTGQPIVENTNLYGIEDTDEIVSDLHCRALP